MPINPILYPSTCSLGLFHPLKSCKNDSKTVELLVRISIIAFHILTLGIPLIFQYIFKHCQSLSINISKTIQKPDFPHSIPHSQAPEPLTQLIIQKKHNSTIWPFIASFATQKNSFQFANQIDRKQNIFLSLSYYALKTFPELLKKHQ
ncbi:hypothetical protein CLAVI_000503 [Candidatus Clavichlamydia salmonicola]|uniref:hypothetical protein n=1 Tax=Candidatus Clavichlamydia salmonicola TaxID=469812 RepID=UPI001891A438|nr:hypothetical protein [Candidatus Clavichlamydia salmonicola]MBF5050881.1 hypothetical protein [Candidatus Clavichlamydia salmonicola]